MLRIGLIGGEKLKSTEVLLTRILDKSGINNKIEKPFSQNIKTQYTIELAQDLTYLNLNPQIKLNYNNDLNTNTDINKLSDIIVLHDFSSLTLLNLNSIINNKSINLILDNDCPKINNFSEEKKNQTNIVTFGLNSKSLLTLSSIKSDRLLFCIQKPFTTYSGKTIIEQDFIVNYENNYENISYIMSAVATALMSDVEVENLF